MTMDFIEILFNTNHEAPSLPVLVLLVLAALILPPLMRYFHDRRK